MEEKLPSSVPYSFFHFPLFAASGLFRISIFGFRISLAGRAPAKAKAPRPGKAHGAKN
jgi:hypothetical protein